MKNQRLIYEQQRENIQKAIIRKKAEISQLEWQLQYFDALAHGISKAAARKLADIGDKPVMPKLKKLSAPLPAPEEMSAPEEPGGKVIVTE